MYVTVIVLLLYISLIILATAKSPSSTITSSSLSDSLGKRRILSEFREIKSQGLTFDVPFNSSSSLECGIRLGPHNNLLDWHFSFTGIEDSPFSQGIYHGRIRLPIDYPRSAPSICMITPNGRWEVGKDICLSATAHHQETWTPQWNLRTLIMALRGHIITQPREIGSIITTKERQINLAIQSQKFKCPFCGISHEKLSNINNDQYRDDNNNDGNNKNNNNCITLTKTNDDNTESKQLSSKQIKKIKELQKQQFEVYMKNLKKKRTKALVKVLFLCVCFFIGFFYQTFKIYGLDMNMIIDKKLLLQF